MNSEIKQSSEILEANYFYINSDRSYAIANAIFNFLPQCPAPSSSPLFPTNYNISHDGEGELTVHYPGFTVIVEPVFTGLIFKKIEDCYNVSIINGPDNYLKWYSGQFKEILLKNVGLKIVMATITELVKKSK